MEYYGLGALKVAEGFVCSQTLHIYHLLHDLANYPHCAEGNSLGCVTAKLFPMLPKTAHSLETAWLLAFIAPITILEAQKM